MAEAERALLTPRAVAKRLNLSIDRIYRMSQAGMLPRVQCGRTVRFDPAALAAFIAAGGRGVVTGAGVMPPAPGASPPCAECGQPMRIAGWHSGAIAYECSDANHLNPPNPATDGGSGRDRTGGIALP
jgi:excisionase family DNA binding protein